MNSSEYSNYPYPAYEPNKIAAGILAGVVGISLIGWLVQSILAKFQPIRMSILLLLSHLTTFIELILRATLPTETRNSRAAFTTTSVFVAVSFRVILMSNYDFIVRVLGEKEKLSRGILIGTFLCVITSAILMIPAGALSYNPDRVLMSFRLRQGSAAIILIMAIAFYPVWVISKTFPKMKKIARILLIISSLCCLYEALYLVIASVPRFYMRTNEEEFWFYVFQLSPTVLAQITWTICHPSRSFTVKQKTETASEAHLEMQNEEKPEEQIQEQRL